MSIFRLVRLNTVLFKQKNKFSKFLSNKPRLFSTEEQELKNKILLNSLKFIKDYGFSLETLEHGVSESNLSSASVNAIFKNGAFDLIDFFYKNSNEQLSVYLENLVKEGKITRKNDLIRSAILYRLSLIQPYVKHWPNAMAIQTFYPENAIKSIENLLRLCDEIWYQVGDKSTDFSWYSKRLSLALIYKSTELFMIQDKSEDFIETKKFLDNRFNDLHNIYKINQQVFIAKNKNKKNKYLKFLTMYI
jgi:ubiquinone biosynthesis protein COQ9